MRIERKPNIYKWEVRFGLKIPSLVISLQEFFLARSSESLFIASSLSSYITHTCDALA